MVTTLLQHEMTKEAHSEEGRGASAALVRWVGSEEGQRVWGERLGPLTLDQVCHILEETRAAAYVLAISAQFTAVLSTLNHNRFRARLTDYEAAFESGLCFWYDGRKLNYLPKTEQALALVQTLPVRAPLPTRDRKGRRC